jgi:hypothetical protein
VLDGKENSLPLRWWRGLERSNVCVANIKEGDANTKFFHMRVNARRRKNHIHLLKKNQGWVTDHDAKENIIFEHFQSVMGRGEPSARYFNWDELSFDNPELHTHGDPFT